MTDEFREAIDWRTGTISGRGRLTTQAADLIRGAADPEGVAALRALTNRIRARHWELVVLQQENLS